MRPLVLFDIDGTLTKGCHLHGMAFGQAIKDVCGREVSIFELDPRGMTDIQIVRDLLVAHKLKSDEPTIRKVLARIVALYRSAVEDEDIRINPGVKELLDELKGKASLSLITGNAEEIAWMKLRKVGLDRYFQTGGFGNEGFTRWEVGRRSIEKSEALAGMRFKRIFNIGDTVLDVKQGKVLNTVTIAVTTGETPRKMLEEAGPDYLFEDLSEYRRVAGIIEGHDGKGLL